MTIPRVSLAEDFTISRVLTGLWQIADMERDDRVVDLEAAAAAMAPYVEAGFTTFDMADHYGSAEVIAGLCRRRLGPGASLQTLTKWVPKPGAITKEDVREAVQISLDRLQVDRLDLLQFHTWYYADPGWLDCLFWLQELKEEGLIHHLGLTNFDTAHLSVAVHSGIEIVSNQVCFSLLDQRARGPMTEFCLKHGIKLLAFGTVAGGFLTERWLGKPDPGLDSLDTWSQMKYRRYIEVAGGWDRFQELLHTLDGVARRHGVSMANVATRTILEQPAVAGVIVGARLGQSEHIADNQRLFEFSLDETSRAEIEAALSKMTPVPGDCGDEYRKPPFLTASGDLSHHLDSLPAPFPVQSRGEGRSQVVSGTGWEQMAGYSRAVRSGDQIVVSGTTATHRDRAIGGSDAAAQFHFAVDKIEGAIQSLGGRLEDVVRTRVYVRRLADWEAVARAHGRRFGEIQPANTLVQADLVGDEYLVEVEAEAVVGSRTS